MAVVPDGGIRQELRQEWRNRHRRRRLQVAARAPGSAGETGRAIMTQPQTNSALQPTLTRPIASAAEAQRVIGHLSDIMDALIGVVEEETKLVRAGRLIDVVKLTPRKTDLARLYLA